MESNVRGIYRNLTERIKIYNQKAYPEKGTADLREVEKGCLVGEGTGCFLGNASGVGVG